MQIQVAYPANPFTPRSQNFRLYERLKKGPATNYEIMKDLNILNNTGRLSDIRAKMKAVGWTVKGKPEGKGAWSYQLTQ